MKRCQVSMEFILLFSFVFAMLIPLIIVFSKESGNMQDSLASNQIQNIAIKIIDKAEAMYYLGEPSMTTLKVSFPHRVEAVTISNKEIEFELRMSQDSVHTIFETSKVNLTGNLSTHQGIHNIVIKAEGEKISITET